MTEYYINKIYFHYNDNSDYGLYILFELNDRGYLLFDSTSFLLLAEIDKYKNFTWKEINYKVDKGLFIINIKEEELVNYFVEFSNNDILYIYQRIDGLECVEQDFMIVKKEDNFYNEVFSHMNESFVERVKL
ncbi:hypothetical protein ETU09_00215 [Apibacter muscae]|uniref:Uncharacterized protein n=1 Tax=Apibacter muscae TaxID=2509004 RepID=A0A563DKL0_9FLAO|nr:hypothetical protein [Apibacter muscae]TWP30776.1 hypothetical protein ETU09_00215 [Apibacter muscae]